MTQPPTSGTPGTGYREDPPTGEPSWLDRFWGGLRGLGLHRRRNDKWLGGVCSGLADRLGIDPLITRAAFILLGLIFGFGVTLYLVAWVLLPDTEGEISAERALRDGDAGSVVLLVIAGLVLFSGFPWWWGNWGNGVPWGGLVILGLIVWWVWAHAHGRAPGQPRRGETAEEWGRRVGDQAAQWGKRTGDRAAQWGQRMGDNTAQWGQRFSERTQEWGHAPAGREPGAGPSAPTPPRGPQGAPAWEPARPAPAVLPRRPRRRSVGFLGLVVAVGLGLVAYGGVQWANDYYGIPGNAWSVGIAAALGAVGLFLLVAGLAGRKGGFVSFVAGVGIIVALVASVAPRSMSFSPEVTNRTWAPTTLTTDANYSLGAGQGVLDLSNVPADSLRNRTVHASVNMGELRVIVPHDVTTAVDAHVGVGNIHVPTSVAAGSGQGTDNGGVNADRRLTVGSGPTELTITADVGIGSVRVEKE
ncbi:MAG TPA: PspC domain-containing protein [Segeticoccus sp.]|uniref:PspC domain-containing protein n=1 Tax=Segeticoccus sp. TaxID=2706531 RepID=UPI002D810869|nr:PspC domain-containing protein [Segeticoccus sp.]HET8601934.1 PspC domain-containing protein [Segeticoccus sp.]